MTDRGPVPKILFDTGPFLEHGYQVFRNVLPSGVLSGLQAVLEAKVHDQLGAARSELGCPSVEALMALAGKFARDGGAGFEGLSKGTRDTLTGHFSLEARLSPELWAVPRQERFRTLLEALLGTGRLGMHMPPAARFVLPGNALAGVPPHQDLSYNRHLASFLTVWVPLVPIDDQCGGVTIYHGSGFAAERLAEAQAGSIWLPPLAVDGFSERHHAMEPGDVLVLNSTVIHGSRPNRSDRTRFSVDYRFFGSDVTSTKHFLDLQTWQVVAPEGGLHDEHL